MRQHFGRRALSLFLALSMCLTLLPATAAAADMNSVQPTDFQVYAFTGPAAAGSETPITTIDLSQNVYAYSPNGCQMSGLCMWRIEEGEPDIPSVSLLNSVYYSERDGDRYGDRLYTLFSGSMGGGAVTGYSTASNSSHNTLYFGYGEGGGSYDWSTGAFNCSAGFPLLWRSGGYQQTQYILPGDYRFVMYYGNVLYYSSDIFHVTDETGLASAQGCFDARWSLGGSGVTDASKGSDGLVLEMSGFRIGGWNGTVATLSESDIDAIDLIAVGSGGNYDQFTEDYRRYSAREPLPYYGTLSVSGGTVTLSGVTLPDALCDYRVKVTAADGTVYLCDSGLHSLPTYDETTILTTSLPGAETGTAYHEVLRGVAPAGAPLTWAVTDGRLPAGLSLSSTGSLAGIPAEGGTFSFTVTASAPGVGAASATFTLRVERAEKYGYWLCAVKPTNALQGAETDCAVTLRPSDSITPTADSSLCVSLDAGALKSTSTCAVLTPDSGVSAEIDHENSRVTLSFDGSTPITAAEGVALTLKGIVNPDKYSLSVTARSDAWGSSLVSYTMSEAYASISLSDAGGLSVWIENYESIRDLDLRLSVSHALDVEQSGVTCENVGFSELGIERGDPFSVTLEARDAAGIWHPYAEYAGSGDGAGNLITLTPAPAPGDTLSGYTLVTTLGGARDAAADRIYTTLYKAGTALRPSSRFEDGSYVRCFYLADSSALTARSESDFAADAVLSAYDREGVSLAADSAAKTITVDYPALIQTAAVSGTVTDGNAALPGASVIASQTVNGSAYSVNAVTDALGAFMISGLYEGRDVTLRAWADGYAEKSLSAAPGASASIALTRSGQISAVIADGQSVIDPRFTVIKDSRTVALTSFTSGTRFSIPLPAEADLSDGTRYTVIMTSETTEEVRAEAVFEGGRASVTLQPARFGTLDWSGIEGKGFRVLLRRDGGSVSCPQTGTASCSLPAGTYTVYLTSDYLFTSCPEGSYGDFTVRPGETTFVTGLTPPDTSLAVVGGITGPASAAAGSLYQVHVVLESEIYGSANKSFSGFRIDLSNNRCFAAMTVNGRTVGLSSGAGYSVSVYKDSYPELDWSFPLECTLYLYERENAGANQSVSLSAAYGSEFAALGSLSTRALPGIALYAPARIGAHEATKTVNGNAVTLPEPERFAFSGTGVKNTDVRLYDNDVLIAVARADGSGRYSGTASLAGTAAYHTLRAEQDAGGERITAEKELVYDPAGPVLTELLLVRNGSMEYPLSISGAPTAYTATASSTYRYRAKIRNDQYLADLTAPNPLAESDSDPDTLTGKVFFRVFTARGEYLLTAEKNGDTWESGEFSEVGRYPTGVEVIYEAQKPSAELQVTLKDGSGELVSVDESYTFFNADGSADIVEPTAQTALYELLGYENGAVTDADTVDADWDLGYPEWSEEDPNGWTPAGEGASLMSGGQSLSSVLENVARTVNTALAGELSDENGSVTQVSTINGTAAAAEGKSGLTMETRTWVDQPTWTKDGVKWRIEELRSSGYQASSAAYDDYQYLYFVGQFYYDKYGRPSSLMRTVHALGGVDTTEPNPDMFSRTTGEMIGSSLKVVYIYSVKEGKWMRNQTAMIAPKATSPIHLAANQIPNATTPPFRYTDVGSLSSDDAAAMLMAANRTGGMSWGVKLDKVQSSTYAGAALSGCGYLGAKWVGASKNLKTIVKAGDERQIVKVGGQYFVQGEYKLTVEESIVTGVSWIAGQVPQGSETKFGDIGGLRKQLLDNYAYYARLESNPAYASRAADGKRETKALLEKLGDVEYAIEMAGVQNAFTDNVTEQLTGASGLIGLFGGPIGAEASFCIDLYSAYLKAANDTNNAEVKEAVERLLHEVDSYKASDSQRKGRMKENEQHNKDYNNETGFPIYDVDENVFTDPFDSSYQPQTEPQPTAESTPVHDPSGIVYEAVLENPVEGAVVTLWKYDEAGGVLLQHDDTYYLGQPNPLVTDESGFYRWDVPEGEWFVTAGADGYPSGSSRNDRAATVTKSIGDETVRFLPVLPPQLDVNIPLVDASAPTVESVTFAPEGIEVTFSKYMRDGVWENGSVLSDESFILADEQRLIDDFTLEPVTQGHTGANIAGESVRTYTKTVRLVPSEGTLFGGKLTLIVSGDVTSYAGTALGGDFRAAETVGGGSGASDYVERAYETILGRTGDEAGVAHWTEALSGGTSAGEIIAEFFRSEEYKDQALPNSETVRLCYEAMLSREPDAEGLANWTKLLDDGYSTTKLVSEFVESPEFAAICETYGLTAGHIALSERDENSNITRFVQRCYTFALSREADEAGLNEWCAHLLTQDLDPERVAFGFVFSDESKAMARSDEDFIAMLYRMMLDREPDAAGLENWVSALAQNTAAEIAYDAAFETGRSEADAIDQTRQNIYALFAASDEFAQMIANFGF